jgi:hypothetical protein
MIQKHTDPDPQPWIGLFFAHLIGMLEAYPRPPALRLPLQRDSPKVLNKNNNISRLGLAKLYAF